jgi:C1A family cysteine protease
MAKQRNSKVVGRRGASRKLRAQAKAAAPAGPPGGILYKCDPSGAPGSGECLRFNWNPGTNNWDWPPDGIPMTCSDCKWFFEGAAAMRKLSIRQPSKHGGYGWVHDLPDTRDLAYSAPLLRFPRGLPPFVDLRSKCPPVYDQGQLGSCTGNAIAGAVEFDQHKQGRKEFIPSRLFIYYNERVIERTVSQDSGAQVRDGIKSVAKLGAPPEAVWPYIISKFSQKPPNAAYRDAKDDLVTSYSRVPQELNQMQGCLAEGYPFVFGFTVYSSFEGDDVAKTGIVPMPTSGGKVVGGHCVVAVGYDDKKRMFIIRNSWGADWGIKGYCMMPFEYLLRPHLASDFWTIRSANG